MSGSDAPNAASVKDAKSLAEYLKHKMLAAIADKICNSLRKSNVNSIQEARMCEISYFSCTYLFFDINSFASVWLFLYALSVPRHITRVFQYTQGKY